MKMAMTNIPFPRKGLTPFTKSCEQAYGDTSNICFREKNIAKELTHLLLKNNKKHQYLQM